ncbi:MAG TPA: carbamoyltransferase [Candidatus Margulisiibacteriota bacterium]|nr:carbamoyltransferase [Candidatus Margulisiibacteriota bacterium]
MNILGINAYHPDSSACVIVKGKLIAAVEEERFLRIKHWAGFPAQSIRYCLKEAGLELRDIDYICLNRDPGANLGRKAIFALLKRPSLSLVKNRLANILKIKGIKDTLGLEFSLPSKKIKAKFFNIEHHRSHLASSFFVSPFKEATVISIDGFGDFSSCMVARGVGNKLKVLYEINFPHSLGIFYTAFTQFLGFKNFGDEYKVMGLSAYGKPRYVREIEETIFLRPRGRFVLGLDFFSFYRGKDTFLWDNMAPVIEDVFSDKFIRKFGLPREKNEELSGYHCDIASSIQKVYEDVFFHILNYAYEITSNPNLCLAGGCALNSLANGKIFERTPFMEVYIQPAASDAGGALGAGYYLHNQILGKERSFLMDKPYWGPGFSEEDIKNEIYGKNEALLKLGCAIEEVKDKDELCSRSAKRVAEGKILGWFQGRMEWGPRALGNRSILADPRNPQMKDILNARIKKREWFRPFAPAILLERVGEYFEEDYPDPFMLKVYPVREDKRRLIPAVTHIDGTGRLQTVSEDENPLFWQLIREFEKISGIPILLNTSFNENEPIVCAPQEAIDCFLRSKIDVLALGRWIIERKTD